MDNYLNTWLSNFPDLRHLLSEQDKAILGTIDPMKYIYHNLTRNSEVIRIINEHKPQAWKWEKMFPNLKNLSPEDHAILDKMVTTNYITDLTEEDVLRIIEFRKKNARKELEESEAKRAEKYYAEHEEEILKERRDRRRLIAFNKWIVWFGLGFLTAGIVLQSLMHIVIGVILAGGAWAITTALLKKLNMNSVIPKPTHKVDDPKLGTDGWVFLILYYVGYLGTAIMLGSLLIWGAIDWDAAETIMYVGLITACASILTTGIMIVATSSQE